MCEPVNKHNRTAALSIRWGLFAFALLLVAGFAFTYFQQQRSIDAAQARIDELNATLDELQLTAAAMQSDLDFAQTDAYIERMGPQGVGVRAQGEIKFIAAEDEAAEEALTSQEDATEPTAPAGGDREPGRNVNNTRIPRGMRSFLCKSREKRGGEDRCGMPR